MMMMMFKQVVRLRPGRKVRRIVVFGLLGLALAGAVHWFRPVVAQQALTGCGTLNLANTTYTLQNDASSNGTCFTVSGSGTVLNLNGHTVTYDNFAGAGVPNAGFESGTGTVPTDWNLSAAPSAERRSTSTYPVVGQWYLAFNNPAASHEIVSGWSTLPASSQAMVSFVNGTATWEWAVQPVVTLWVEFQDGTTAFTTTGNGGVQSFTFTTRPSTGQYRAHYRIDTPPSGNQYGNLMAIDQFDLRPTGNVGVRVTGANATVRNGTIIQGQGGGTFSHGVNLASSADGALVDAVTATASGMIAMPLYGSYLDNVEIRNSTFTGLSPGIFRRNDLENAVTLANLGTNNRFHDNTVTGGKGFGCLTMTGGTGQIVSNNTCATQSSITNHHGFIFYNTRSAQVSNNTINATYGQGIVLSTGFGGAVVTGNTITLNGIAPNVEYGIISFDAIRLNNYSLSETASVTISGNTINITGGLDPFYAPGFSGVDPIGKVLNGIMQNANLTSLLIENNTITINVTDPEVLGSCWEIGDAPTPDAAVFANNVCASNSKNVVIGGYAATALNVLHRSNTFRRLTPVVGTYHTLFARRTSADINNVRFLDTRLENGASFDSAYIYTNAPPSEYDFTVEWYLDVTVQDTNSQPVPNAAVEARDSTNAVVFTGMTNAEGFIDNIELVQYQRYGPAYNGTATTQRDRTPHTMTVSRTGYTTATTTVTMDGTKSLSLQLAAGGQPGCTPIWQCTDWSICSNGQQTRTCTDLAQCGTNQGRPTESQTCIVGNTYYVATNGSNTTGDGSLNNPWQGIEYAADQVPDNGSTIIVRNGTYGAATITRRFAVPMTIRAENSYRAILQDPTVSFNVLRFFGASNITFKGFVINRPGPFSSVPGSGSYMVHVQNYTGNTAEYIRLEDNIFHDNYRNDLLKINDGARFITVKGNIFYNQPGFGDEHIDVNVATDIDITDNIFFNDFAGSSRAGINGTHPYIVIKNSTSSPLTHRMKIQRNIFLNWEGLNDQAFLLLGEDGRPIYEVDDVLVENNLFIGNGANPIAAAVNYKGAQNVRFRANTVVGDFVPSPADPSGAFATRINIECMSPGSCNPPNDDLQFRNNIWSDPTGTMGRFSNIATSDAQSITINRNLYWNGGSAVPINDPLMNRTLDPSAVLGDPLLGSQAGLVLPRWNPASSAFLSGNTTQRQEFVRLVQLYGTSATGSAAIDAADAANMPADDILGAARAGRGDGFDIGAVEYVSAASTCTPNWQCDAPWSACINGLQTRACTDQNACGQDPPTDLIRRSCDEVPPGAVTDLRAS